MDGHFFWLRGTPNLVITCICIHVYVLPLVNIGSNGQYCRRTAPRSVSWTCCPSVSIVDVLPLGQYRGRAAPRSVSWTCCPTVSIVDVLPLGQYSGMVTGDYASCGKKKVLKQR